MLHCLQQLSLTAKTKDSPQALEGGLVDDNASSSRSSPTVNLSQAYTLAVQASCNKEIWSKLHHEVPPVLNVEEVAQIEFQEEPLQLEDVLEPSREHVEETISRIKQDALNQLVAKYFDNSEQTARLCIRISQNVNKARLLYAPLHKILDVLPLDSDSLSQAQYDLAFDIFLQFDSLANHFPRRDTYNFNDMLDCSFQLKNQLELRLHKSRSKVKLLRRATRGSALCLVAATVGAVISAVVIATHGLAALVAITISPACLLPSNMKKKEVDLMQLDYATKGIFFLYNHLNTVKILVGLLHDVVESYNGTIRFGLVRGRDRYRIREALKQLRRKHSAFLEQLVSLEEHLCVCFTAISTARHHLLNYLRHQNQAPR
ncbi:UPF0496 protein At3g19330-like [Lycium ferocissimum]|uniref:UPF0496 protein At3g19330-like n=1 Tax=Lycium ferocissimum TaxID=112874 RepID=UPI0028151DB3|nr:UPF0496 protein At3g19330-like [Lycium ferocissimum]